MAKFYWVTPCLIFIIISAYFAISTRKSWSDKKTIKTLAIIYFKQFSIGLLFCACITLTKNIIGIALSKYYFFEFQNLNLNLLAIAILEPLLIALVEEITNRGLVFGMLLWGLSKLPNQFPIKVRLFLAIVLQALFFTYLHHYHLHITVSNLSHFSVGIILAIFTWQTKALWMAIGFHFAWNFFQKLSLGIHVYYMPKLQGILTIEANLPLIGTCLTCLVAIAMLIALFSKPKAGSVLTLIHFRRFARAVDCA